VNSNQEYKSQILGVILDSIDVLSLHQKIIEFIISNQKSIISNVNIQALSLSFKNKWFRDFLNQSDIVFCDGFGIVLGAKILGFDIKHRNTPPDWIPLLANKCAENNNSLAFLGSKPGIAEKTAEVLKRDNLTLNIPFTHHGYFNKSLGHPENEAVIQSINAVKPDILLVGFGMPIQEKWIMENFERLDVKVFLPVGAAFDYVSGNVRRAPRWMTDHGLEWLGRLIIEPRRLWKRYIIGIPVFFYRILLQKFGLLKYD
jgi:N-acetylglucosaminyldiphosphoundecaprenol N-acetyl-beta-D-mannosaminyltransferase